MAATALENLVGDMTLSELGQRSGKTVSDIVSFALGSKSPRATTSSNGAPRAAKTTSSKTKTKTTSTTVDVRTRASHAELDAKLLEVIKTLGTARASDLACVGGDEFQRRAALHRLIEARKIRRTGVARATTYTAK